jgi:hypothetical protein
MVQVKTNAMNNPFEIILQELAEIKERLPGVTEVKDTSTLEIIDRKELKKRLRLTDPTIIKMGKEGMIPELRAGNSVRYNWQAVVTALSK